MTGSANTYLMLPKLASLFIESSHPRLHTPDTPASPEMLGVERSPTPRTPMKWEDWAEQKLQTKYDEAWRELSADHRKTLARLERADLSAHEIRRRQQNEIELFRQRERQLI